MHPPTLDLAQAAEVLKTHPDTVADCIAHRGLPAAVLPELIDTAWIAQRIACRRDYVTDRLTKRPDFPLPVVNVSQKMRRWSRDEVERWLATAGRRSAQPSPGNSGTAS